MEIQSPVTLQDGSIVAQMAYALAKLPQKSEASKCGGKKFGKKLSHLTTVGSEVKCVYSQE